MLLCYLFCKISLLMASLGKQSGAQALSQLGTAKDKTQLTRSAEIS